jgi:hypothetical protein
VGSTAHWQVLRLGADTASRDPVSPRVLDPVDQYLVDAAAVDVHHVERMPPHSK